MKIPGAGEKFKLSLVISDQMIKLRHPYVEPESAKLRLALTEYNSSHAVAWSKMALEKGQNLELELTPTLVTTGDELINVEASKRQCKFNVEGEKESQLFKAYTHKTCEVECMTKVAIKACGNCIPWNKPQVQVGLECWIWIRSFTKSIISVGSHDSRRN